MEPEIQQLVDAMSRGQYGVFGVLCLIAALSFKGEVINYLKFRFPRNGNGNGKSGMSASHVGSREAAAEWRGKVGGQVTDVKDIVLDNAEGIRTIDKHLESIDTGIQTLIDQGPRVCPNEPSDD